MDAFRKYLPFIILSILGLIVLYVSFQKRSSNGSANERAEILEKAREAKLAKSILKKSESENETLDKSTEI